MLSVGETHTKNYTVAPGHTVPDILPEAPEFQQLPDVFTSGCLLAIMEWACIEHITPHLAEGMITLGIGMDMTHDGACTTGTPLTISCTVTAVSERKVSWQVRVEASANGALMGTATHTRAVVPRDRFSQRVNEATAVIGGETLHNP